MENNMHTPVFTLTTEKMLQLSVEEHTSVLARLWRKRKGHVYVQGETGTGKTTVARCVATQLKADFFSYELLSPEAFKAEQADIIARLAASRKKVLILDGFFPQHASHAFSTLLRELREQGVSLFIFSQESLVPGSPQRHDDLNVSPDAFTTIAEFRYASRERHAVTLHQAK